MHRVITPASGQRVQWQELPERLKDWVGDVLGGPIVTADSQIGGFSPGTADRVQTASGDRAFVKAASSAQNEFTPRLHRQEAHVVAHLPRTRYTPSLIAVYDDGDWVAMVLEDIDGRPPSLPWRLDELDAVMTALDELAHLLTPSPLHHLDSMVDAYAETFAGWERIRSNPPPVLDDWVRARLDDLVEMATRGLAALAGSTLVHGDVRADNLLIQRDGSVFVVDWPWASNGASWVDRLFLLVNVDLYGGHDPDRWIAQHLRDAVTPAEITCVIAGLCGYFTDIARQPPARGLPTVRAFQADQAYSTLAWLRRRIAT